MQAAVDFDYATLSFVGWAVLVSTFFVFIAVIELGRESLIGEPRWLAKWLCGLVALVMATAWFKIMRIVVETVGLSICKDSKDHDDGSDH